MEAESIPTQGSDRAPYGRACMNCARGKCRCIYKPNQPCERCQRLKKECIPSASFRNRAKKPPGSKTAQLEKKLDGIVSLLRAQSTITSQHASIPTPQSSIEARSPPNLSDALAYAISDEDAEEQLGIFRRALLPFFPFVHIPAELRASELRIQKPFLWFVIMSVTTKSVAHQLAMGTTIQQIVSERLIAEHEQSFDMLLGLICYLAWFHYHKKNKPYLVMWTQITIGLLFELGIHRADSKDVGQFSNSKSEWFPPRTLAGPTRTIEERRAILGVYIVTSMVWTSMRQMEPLRWTPYMDDCVRVLRRERETDMDIVLTLQAKCYVVVDQITRPPMNFNGDDESRPPAAFLVKALQHQLQDLRQNLPEEIQSDRTALLSLYSTDIIGKEALLYAPGGGDQIDLKKLEGLELLLTAIERWISIFHQIPISMWRGIPFSIFGQWSHCIILLFKLSTLEEVGWDVADVKKRLDLLDLIELFAQNLEKLPEEMQMINDSTTGEIGALFKGPPLMRGMKAKLAAELNPHMEMVEGGDIFVVPEGFETMGFPDDPWMTEIFTSLGQY